ncbi:AraC family transcriptional regulator [Microbacterium sp. ASV49]|uniref:AraC family transcriptional regulator n=1 Tax=Microbacterium candidum TaxID=3041922 RepID=A0ABT7MVA3_9MICO|nr:AraC family transcriptional regulator [Microbacterium sp. ASV49]MDL9978386.1 AraC family transcriptional regulator [Microbacterium sp. ASV49]
MDESMIGDHPPYRREGFLNQRLCVIPRPQVEAALSRPGTRRLTVTDAGCFPAAAGHRRVRAKGAPETIVILCVAGSGSVTIAGETHVISRGSCVTIPAHTPHEYRASHTDPWTIWWLHVRGTDAAELTGPMLGPPEAVSRLRSVDRVIALFDELISILERRPTPAHLLAASGIAWQLLTRIAVDSILPAEGSALERAMHYLDARVDGTISVPELAALVGVSASHLSAMFRQATGSGPAAYHASLKMARARSLLDTTDLTIAEVAATVGYPDPLYFSRQFRRTHGMSPSTYRSQHKG